MRSRRRPQGIPRICFSCRDRFAPPTGLFLVRSWCPSLAGNGLRSGCLLLRIRVLLASRIHLPGLGDCVASVLLPKTLTSSSYKVNRVHCCHPGILRLCEEYPGSSCILKLDVNQLWIPDSAKGGSGMTHTTK
jgi:hypothetical protein